MCIKKKVYLCTVVWDKCNNGIKERNVCLIPVEMSPNWVSKKGTFLWYHYWLYHTHILCAKERTICPLWMYNLKFMYDFIWYFQQIAVSLQRKKTTQSGQSFGKQYGFYIYTAPPKRKCAVSVWASHPRATEHIQGRCVWLPYVIFLTIRFNSWWGTPLMLCPVCCIISARQRHGGGILSA